MCVNVPLALGSCCDITAFTSVRSLTMPLPQVLVFFGMVLHRFETPPAPSKELSDPTSGRRAAYLNFGLLDARVRHKCTLGNPDQREACLTFLRGGTLPRYAHVGTGHEGAGGSTEAHQGTAQFGLLNLAPLLPLGHALLGSVSWEDIETSACDLVHRGTPHTVYTERAHLTELRRLYHQYACADHSLTAEARYLIDLNS